MIQKDNGYQRFGALLLPLKLVEAEAKKIEEERQRELEEDAALSVGASRNQQGESADGDARKTSEQTLDIWPPETLQETSGPFIHKLYTDEGIHSMQMQNERAGPRNEKDRKYVAAMLRDLRIRGGNRILAAAPENYEAKLEQLRTEHPNFEEVIDYIAAALALSVQTGKAPQWRPILLDGLPGIGKTMFTAKLAELMGSGFLTIHMETAQTASDLAGTSDYWANAKVGRFFNLLVNGEYANPIVLLDEVDKARATPDHDPKKGLYSLLERGTAKSWSDLCLPDLNLDVSRVYWVLTSNNRDALPVALLSRMKVFEIAPLTPQQSRQLAACIFAATVEELIPGGFDSNLPAGAVELLAQVPPRVMQHLSEELIARAVRLGKRAIAEEDFGGPNTQADSLCEETGRVYH